MGNLSTGIAELDLILGGGIPAGSLMIIAGAPGTGKTILAQQICFANASPERKALYYTTLSEPHSKLIRHLEQFTFFDSGALGKSVDFIRLPERAAAESGLRGVTAEVVRKSFEEHPVAVVIDSARALHDMESRETFRSDIYDLAGRVAHTEAILILVGEYSDSDFDTVPEFAVADAILQLANESEGALDRRWLRVLKMRGAGPLGGRHTFRIGSQGVRVYPRLESLPPARASAPAGRTSTGIKGLDGMTGGGWPAGSATLVVGPSGAGKTVVGLHFVAEGLAKGERCVFISFQESERQLIGKAATFGWKLAQEADAGKLIVRAIEPVEMSLDVIAAQMLGNGQATRVVVDSLTEIERSSHGLGRLAGYLWALVEQFRSRGSTVLITSETEAFFGPAFELAHGVSFVVDNVLLLRYAELESEIRRAMSVVKMRDSDHIKSLVEFEIGKHGIAVKGKFAGMAGVLTGTPVRTEERFKEFFNK